MATDGYIIEESGLRFEFGEDVQAVKFDDQPFYRRAFNKLPEAKGVDILADSKEIIQLIEIKNCSGHERENMWRTSVNNSRVASVPRELDTENRNSLDIEVAKKAASTIYCIYGAWTKSEHSENAAELLDYWKGISELRLWLNCQVTVVDSSTYKERYFKVS